MVLSFLNKNDYWSQVGGVDGFIAAVKQLGPDYCKLDSKNNGYTKSDTIWGRVASFTQIPKKDAYETRKWLYTTWHENRRKVRTTFFSTVVDDHPNNSNESSNDVDANNRINKQTMPHNVLISIPSIEPKIVRSTDKKQPRYIHHFTMNYDQWRSFYDHKNGIVYDGWSDKLISYLTSIGITCTIIFRYHHTSLIDSRKKNSNIFSASGHCKATECPMTIDIAVKDTQKQKDKDLPYVFKVILIGDPHHDPEKEKTARPITGSTREAIAKEVERIGALAVYERNVRNANEDLLKAGNFTEVPSIEVLNTLKQQYDKKHRLDEDIFKELRMFRFCTQNTGRDDRDVKGFVQAGGEWPFFVYFFTEAQLDRFIQYFKTDKYSCLHIDATGSVIRQLKDQKEVFFYCMVFHDKNSAILPLSGALLTDHTAASITAYFNCLRAKLSTRSKVTRPAFIIIDFSAALINSVLASFNVENIHTYLRRCYNTLNRKYNTKQLRNMTFLRLCCSHAMKAFSRSLFKLNITKETHRHLMSFFAVLLNSVEFTGAFNLFKHIIHIYGDPYFETAPDEINLLLNTSDVSTVDIESYLQEIDVQDDKPMKQDFLDETDTTTDPIIHQSPFNIKACADILPLQRILKKEKLHREPSNPVFSKKIVRLLYKWFAYIPFWSGILTNFFERYAKEKEPISTSNWQFGHGRVSNASIETYFRTIKMSVLENKTTHRPYDFLIRNRNHIYARFKGDSFDVAQSSRNRKKASDKTNDLTVKDEWRRRPLSKTKQNKRSVYFNDEVTETAACKLTKGTLTGRIIRFDDKPNSSTMHDSTKLPTFDDDLSALSVNGSMVSSCEVSLLPENVQKNNCDFATNSQAALSVNVNNLPMEKSSQSCDNIFSALLTITEPSLSRALSPKRSYHSSDSDCSISKTYSPKQLREKKAKASPQNSINRFDLTLDKDYRTTNIGELNLTWPPYGIEYTKDNDEHFSIYHTCAIDTGLFILYHAYKSGTDDFRNLFESDTLETYTFLRHTFRLIETHGWTVARMHWLIEKQLLKNKTKDGRYDLMNTMEEVVFRFIKPMQTFLVSSKCSCVVCPRPTRKYTHTHITLTKIGGRFINFIPNFITATERPCRADLGLIEPLNYPANYGYDEKFPVYDVESNTSRTEFHYICEAFEIVDVTSFMYTAPFVVIDTGKDSSLMIDLPDPLHIGKYSYRLSGGINNTNAHFIAIIKTNNNKYYYFDDLHYLGCRTHDGSVLVEFAIYVLQL